MATHEAATSSVGRSSVETVSSLSGPPGKHCPKSKPGVWSVSRSQKRWTGLARSSFLSATVLQWGAADLMVSCEVLPAARRARGETSSRLALA